MDPEYSEGARGGASPKLWWLVRWMGGLIMWVDGLVMWGWDDGDVS